MICETLLAFSLHLTSVVADFNFIHPHRRCETEKELITGVYYNSNRDLSFYLGKVKEVGKWDIDYGVVTGYNKFLVPMLRIRRGPLFISPTHVTEYWITEYPDHTVTVVRDKTWTIALGLEFKIQ